MPLAGLARQTTSFLTVQERRQNCQVYDLRLRYRANLCRCARGVPQNSLRACGASFRLNRSKLETTHARCYRILTLTPAGAQPG